MSFLDPIPKGTICTNDCDHLATIKWVGSGDGFSAAHGNYTYWCECCALDAQLEYAKKAADKIPNLEKELEEALKTCK